MLYQRDKIFFCWSEFDSQLFPAIPLFWQKLSLKQGWKPSSVRANFLTFPSFVGRNFFFSILSNYAVCLWICKCLRTIILSERRTEGNHCSRQHLSWKKRSFFGTRMVNIPDAANTASRHWYSRLGMHQKHQRKSRERSEVMNLAFSWPVGKQQTFFVCFAEILVFWWARQIFGFVYTKVHWHAALEPK